MSVDIDTYKSLAKTFIMPAIEKIYNAHSYVIGGFGVHVNEDIGEVVLRTASISLYININYGVIGSGLSNNSERAIMYNEVINALTKMGFNKENLSFGYDTISFKNFEFHKKLLNKNEEHL